MIQPPALRQGDKAVIISPAGKIDEKTVREAETILSAWGLKVRIGENALCETGRFSGFVEQRLADLQRAMDDPEIKLIFCSRGGYGMVHLLGKLNFEGIRKHPKWVVGFSDITALHAALQYNGVESIHAPMAKHFADEGADDVSVRYLKSVLAGQPAKYDISVGRYDYMNRIGRASGRLFGGNISVFCGLMGTKCLSIPRKGILFIEDIGEAPYRVDRMMHQLKLAGIFERISGLIVGQFTDFEEDNSMFTSLYESIMAVVGEYSFPVCFDFPVGHVKLNFPLTMGKKSTLVVHEKNILFKQ
ncbi:MAG: LD-carboxypeptidase [Dysgonamonadaceae bacterium]|jgi:muramoyltetrapeptide carboxypeptidase|nr:LD-carboxypeptidase [Dysgonamonadaceae bacterium]